ncbi:ribonuclease inhibitor [Rickettsia endosymbiont of Seladonia tumulorum]|uniref:ribonuclease inhibitor n=1 Tax=Rickettsia endosymbiont of Seladonia tumulorum TaxID=3066270 RepID=UPI00313F0281
MLNLHKNQIDDSGAKELAAALKANNHLTMLFLGGNKIGNTGAKFIAEALKGNNSLTELYFSNNNISNSGAKFIAEALKDNDSLTHLDLSGNNISKTILETINEYLQRNKTIAEKKAQNLNTEKEVEKKYEEQQKQILSKNNELAETVNKFFHDPTSVSLCYQIITDDFAKLVADKLKVIKTITAIDFMGSTISDQSIKIITEALKASTQLKKLDFSGCDLGNQKISVLAEVLQLKTLTHLCLNANYIGTVGINAIIEALKESTTIMRIDLEQNNMDQQSQIIIEKYLQRNKNLLEEHSNFQKLVDKLNDKIANNANIKDKSIIEDTIKYIIQKTPLLIRTIDRDQIITDIHKLLNNKFTTSKFMGIKEELEELIEQQNINDDTNVLGADSMFG